MDIVHVSNNCRDIVDSYMNNEISDSKLISILGEEGSSGWLNVSYLPDLQESFIDKFKDLLSWDGISCNQNLSREFILNNLNRLNKNNLLILSKLDVEIITKLITSTQDKRTIDNYFNLVNTYQSLPKEELDKLKFLKEICG